MSRRRRIGRAQRKFFDAVLWRPGSAGGRQSNRGRRKAQQRALVESARGLAGERSDFERWLRNESIHREGAAEARQETNWPCHA
jgi:hypothetical protein